MAERRVSDEERRQLETSKERWRDTAWRYAEQVDNLIVEIARKDEDLLSLIKSSETYMKYHGQKFYGEQGRKTLSGLWPAIAKARAALKTTTANSNTEPHSDVVGLPNNMQQVHLRHPKPVLERAE